MWTLQKGVDAMKLAGCENIVFTSTSVYGDAEKIPTPENAELKPLPHMGK